MASTDARPIARKNVAWRYYFDIRNSEGALVTSWAGQDSEISGDGASYTDCTNEATEIGTSGTGYIDLTAAEMNYDCVLLKITVTNSGALPVLVTIFPEELGDFRTDISTLATSSALSTVDGKIDGIKAKTDNLPASPAAVGSQMTLTSDYDSAKTAAPASTALSSAVWTSTKAGYLDAAVSSRSVAGDQMTLTSDYDSAKTAAQASVLSTVASNVDSILDDTGTSGVVLSAASVDSIWDEVLTGATHNVASSAGRRLRQLASQVVWDGIAQGAGSDNNQIQLDSGASSTNGAYDPSLIAIVGGTGAGQCRLILEYNGSTKIATVDRGWKVQPDSTSEFIIYAHPGREHVNEGLAQAGSSNTITLNANASTHDDNYKNQIVFIRSGAGEDQARIVTAYNGTTKVATVSENWNTTPDSTSAYVMLPFIDISLSAQEARDSMLLAPTSGTTVEAGSIDGLITSIGSGAGSGDIAVNHNTGGTDNLRYTNSSGVAISGASIRAYVTSEYESNPLTCVVRGETFTGDDGRWTSPLYLTDGVTYTLVFEKSGAYGPTTAEVTV